MHYRNELTESKKRHRIALEQKISNKLVSFNDDEINYLFKVIENIDEYRKFEKFVNFLINQSELQ